MKRFHICYLIAKGLCSGINIQASNYIDAVLEFNTMHGEKPIVYVQELTA
jgi:hypothetical protein